jgi:diacylglycerol O-acyltransferase
VTSRDYVYTEWDGVKRFGENSLGRLGPADAKMRRLKAATPAGVIDRLTGPDLSGFVPDRFGWPAQIGLIAVLDGDRLYDDDGRQLRLGDVRDRIVGQLHLTPRLRQVVRRLRLGLGGPIWVDAQTFNIIDHVKAHLLPAGAGLIELLEACEELRQRPLDPSRPLWELWILPGLPGGQVGMFARLHHSIADGPAGMALLSKLLDHSPDTTALLPWRPPPPPSSRDLLLDNVYRRAVAVAQASRRLLHSIKMFATLRRTWLLVQEFHSDQRTARTSINAPIGSARRMAVVTGSLSAVKAASRATGGTVNDAVLACVAGGLRELLQSRGEGVAGVVLRAMVPVTLHDPESGRARGNRYGNMVVPLPIGEADTIRRLQYIAAQTASRKRRTRPAWGTGVFGSPLMQRLTLPMARRQRVINVHVANVPGPRDVLHLAGARVATAFPLVPLTGSLTIGIGVLSYIDQLNITVVADKEHCPDLAEFTDGLNVAMHALDSRSVAIYR